MSDSEADVDYDELNSAQNRKKKAAGGWQSMGLCDPIFKAIGRRGYRAPTPIQRKVIPLLLDNKDVVAMARTGSGKTAAFLVPMLQKLKQRNASVGARALLVSPTRELALQTFKFMKDLGKYTGLRAVVLVGGDSMEEQFGSIHENPDILIATPGRLMHLLIEMNLKLSNIEYVAFDEADRLFEMGFAEQLTDMLARLPDTRQTVLTSATLPKMLVDFAAAGLHDPVLVRLDVDTKICDNLHMQFIYCRTDDKLALYIDLVLHRLPRTEQTIVFLATKFMVEYYFEMSEKAGIQCACLYGSMDPAARKVSMYKFRERQAQVLLVTDVAARGVDIPLLDNVINVHMSPKAKLFVHRVGRAARAGRHGRAISLVGIDEIPYVVDLSLFLSRPLAFLQDTKLNIDNYALTLGGVPQTIIDTQNSMITSMLNNHSDLMEAKKVADNSMKQYIKSRPVCSAESIRRSKADAIKQSLSTMRVHPLYAGTDSADGLARVELLKSLHTYKPHLTIFETNTNSKNHQWAVMKAKRKAHGKFVKTLPVRSVLQNGGDTKMEADADVKDIAHAFSEIIAPGVAKTNRPPQKKYKTEPKSRKQEEFFVQSKASDFHSEAGLSIDKSFHHAAKAAVIDFMDDENAGAEKRKHENGHKTWDRKKKKFIGTAGDDPKEKMIRLDDGRRVRASLKTGRYERWQKRRRPTVNDDNSTPQQHQHMNAPGRRRWHTKGGADDKAQVPGVRRIVGRRGTKAGRGELKRGEQILKQRNKTAAHDKYEKHRAGKNAVNRVRDARRQKRTK